MRIKLFFISVASLTLSFGVAVADSPKPNILILLADDLGYADVGFNGGKVISTPNIDRLAATGINLTDFRACPMCSPTRAGLLTGRWPGRFGIMRAVIPPWSTWGLPAEEKSIAQLLAPLGYDRRGIVGKWHLGHARQEFLPLAHGFTSFVGCYNGAIDYFTHERDGECDWHRDTLTVREDGYSTDLICAEAVRFIDQSPAGKPWFLYVPFNAPHEPYQAKESDINKYSQFKNPDRHTYAAMVDSMDQAIGKILATVEARADASNTLILFASDNGGIPKVGSDNGPYRGAKLSVYEGGTHVCAAIRWPAGGLNGGKRFGERIGYIDVLPTLVSVTGGALPTNLDGVNFFPALRGETKMPERAWFSYVHQDAVAHASVHLGEWKLVARGDFFAEHPVVSPKLELYDLAADIAESNDVAAQHPERVADLHKRLREFGAWQKTGVAPYAEGRDDFKPPKDWVILKP